MQHTQDARASIPHAINLYRAADDDALSRLAVRLYLALLGDGLWSGPIQVYAAAYARRFRVAHATITHTLRTLEERGYIARSWRRGQRFQTVSAPADGAKE